ncbi:MAG: hypothetical protein JO063_06410, partial [Pseudonocardiales bacterium]|nr:hypothetical protein [Pseudonocardiales bacterium]
RRAHPHSITKPTRNSEEPTCTETASPDVVRAELIKGATVLRCSTWRQTAENLAKPRTGLGLHPLSDATGSRDAP